MSSKNTAKPGSRILHDHKRVGKIFISPFIHQLGPIQSVSFVKKILPEIVWIGLLNESFGYRRTGEIVVEVSQVVSKVFEKSRIWFAFVSDYLPLNETDKNNLIQSFSERGILKDLQKVITPFAKAYPENPLSFLSGKEGIPMEFFIKLLKDFLGRVFDKRSREAVMMQAMVVYMGFVQKKLFTKEGLALADFPEVEHYPKTERSRQVGAAICALLNTLSMTRKSEDDSASWSHYFWNQGLRIEPLSFRKGTHE